MTGRRRRVLRIVGAVGLVALWVGVVVGWRWRDQTRADQVQAERELAVAAGTLDRMRSVTEAAAAEEARTLVAIADSRAAAGEVTTELDAILADVQSVALSMVAATGRIGAAEEITDTSAATAADIRTCLDGLAEATAASHRGEIGAVILLMTAVAEPCRRAQVGLGGGTASRFPYSFPDPYVLRHDGEYFAYATNAAGGAVQVLRSPDLATWTFAGTGLASVPAWAQPGATWAPSALARGGGVLLYYTVRDRLSGRQCISVARSATPVGPFVDTSQGPLVCELTEGGSIDPSPVVGPDGQAYLLWKAEGETAGGRASLRARRLTPDGTALTGPTATLLTTSQGWEGRTVEGPSMISTARGWLLLYSANDWNTDRYAVGAAWCESPLGPCRKQGEPILRTTGQIVGPGGAEAFVGGDGQLRVAYHAWQGADVGYPASRYLHIGTLSVGDEGATIALDAGPSG